MVSPSRTRTSLLPLAVLALLVLGATVVSARRRGGSRGRVGLQQCATVRRFRVNDVEPLGLARGHVTLVALLTSTCGFCLEQASRLQNMSQILQDRGRHVHMMIINGGPRPRPGQVGPLEDRVSFPVYHDDNGHTIWRRVFMGNKDDIFILDGCGKLTYRIPLPYSYLGYNFVQRGLQRTFTRNPCNCQPDGQNPHDMMMRDAPAAGLGHSPGRRTGSPGPGRHHRQRGRLLGESGVRGRRGGRSNGLGRGPSSSHRSLNRSWCSWHDTLCRDLRKARRKYNQFRRRHGFPLQHGSGMSEEQILRIFERSQRGMIMGPA